MNKAEKIAISGVTGTSFMTLFSYVASIVKKENYSEPEHLGTMIHRFIPGTSKKENQVAGWVAHYVVGLAFATAYIELWESGKIKPSVKNGLLLGAISGALAVAIWKLTFKIHPLPPWINFNKFYMQLVPAHIVFGLFAAVAYRLLKEIEKHDEDIAEPELSTVSN